MQSRTFTLLLLAFSTLLLSCERYSYNADLEISVKGLLSGNPRADLPVQLFYSREDAKALFDPATPLMYTNEWGEVFVFGLEPGIEYYIRVDALLDTSIRRVNNLRSGTNSCTVRIL